MVNSINSIRIQVIILAVFFTANLSAKILSSPCSFTPTLNPHDTTTLCQNTTAYYSAQKDSNNNYYWRADGGIILNGQNSDTVSVKWGQAGIDTLWMIETSVAGCSDSVSQTITVKFTPVAHPGKDTCIFAGDSAKIGGAAVPGYAYSWTSYPFGYMSAKASNTVRPSVTTTYYLTVTDTATRCSSGGQVVVNFTAHPLNTGFTVDTLSDSSFLFTADDILESGYVWSFGDGDTSQGYDPSHTYHHGSGYKVTLTITNYGGCSTTLDTNLNVAIAGINTFSAEALHLDIYPNPFSAATDIQYSLTNPANVQISVYDVNGRPVAILANENETPGSYTVPFDAEKYHCSEGFYFVKIIVGNMVIVRQVVRI